MRSFPGIALIGAILFTSSCKKEEAQVINKFSDPVFIKIADFQDKRLSDSLYRYFSSPNPAYRKEAALAFGSIQDTLAIPYLSEVLVSDKDASVRAAAAYALGQTGTDNSVGTLVKVMRYERSIPVMREILEAYAKTATRWQAEIKPQLPFINSTVAWSYYRAGLKGISDSLMNEKAALFLSAQYDEQTRLAAAHYFSRGATTFNRHAQSLLTTALQDSSADVRMTAALALRKLKPDTLTLLPSLRHIISTEKDYRVRVGAVRSLQSFPLVSSHETLKTALNDQNINVAIAASEVLVTIAQPGGDTIHLPKARDYKSWRVQANLYEALLKTADTPALVEEIKSKIVNASGYYEKAALLVALGQSVSPYEFVTDQLLQTDTAIVRSAAATALVDINYNKKFDLKLREKFLTLYQQALSTHDVAVIGLVASALGDSTLKYKEIIKDITFLRDAKNSLSLPKDNEALQSLEATIAYLEGNTTSKPVKNEFNHPIDWELVKTIPKDQHAIIETSKGNIVIRLLVEEAPGSVANFVALVNKNYFTGKFFHRVVPNFVVQAGCNRGDGWGGEDYSIRSEFSGRRYKTGSVGMASAGKDTEGTQWFITHSPTPHLDGRYTIFAEVLEGMDIVHVLEVGDQILGVELTK